MVVWRATEKDCWVVTEDEKQEKAECVICFEEFEEGDAIARLECLCRYHKVGSFLFLLLLLLFAFCDADPCRNVSGSGSTGRGTGSVRCMLYTTSKRERVCL